MSINNNIPPNQNNLQSQSTFTQPQQTSSTTEPTSSQEIPNEYTFKFPLNGSFSNVEIPFAFQTSIDSTSPNSSSSNKFYSYITLKDTPTLHLDISNEANVDKLLLPSTIESLKSDNKQKEKKISSLETSIASTKAENENLKAEISRIKEEILLRQAKIAQMTQTLKTNEDSHIKQFKEIQNKITEKNAIYQKLNKHYEIIKHELDNKKDYNAIIESAREQLNQLTLEYSTTKDYFNKKFSSEPYNELYIRKSLQNDLIEFQAYVTEQIKKTKPKLHELINLIQDAVNQSIGIGYEVKLYGSHATNLCLPWSDLDIVIINKEGKFNSYVPLHDLFKFLENKNYFNTINFIGTASVPLIKIHTKDNFNRMSVDISLEDTHHYGIKCVSLVNRLIEEYEALTPMVLALKNILKQANLNDPYKGGLSSYGLILLIVFFLNEQMEQNMDISINDDNLGRLFYEFLYFYGIKFDPTKITVSIDIDNQDSIFYDQTQFVSVIYIIIFIFSFHQVN